MQGRLLPADRDEAGLGINDQLRKGEGRAARCLSALGAAQDRAHPADQLLRAEGLDHVIVGAQLEAGDTVGLIAAGGEQDDGHVGAVAQEAGEGKAVHTGEHDVEDDQVG